MLDLGIFGLELENNIITFEISTLEFAYLPNFAKKRKCLNLGPKMPYLCFWARTKNNNYCHI